MGYPITEPIAMKIQMESPGWLKLSTKSILGLLTIGVFFVSVSGGGLEFTRGEGLNMYTNGMLESVSDFLDRRADRQLIESARRSIDSMKIDTGRNINPYLELIQIRQENRTEY